MGATNRPQDLDSAILRRMPTRFHINQPVRRHTHTHTHTHGNEMNFREVMTSQPAQQLNTELSCVVGWNVQLWCRNMEVCVSCLCCSAECAAERADPQTHPGERECEFFFIISDCVNVCSCLDDWTAAQKVVMPFCRFLRIKVVIVFVCTFSSCLCFYFGAAAGSVKSQLNVWSRILNWKVEVLTAGGAVEPWRDLLKPDPLCRWTCQSTSSTSPRKRRDSQEVTSERCVVMPHCSVFETSSTLRTTGFFMFIYAIFHIQQCVHFLWLHFRCSFWDLVHIKTA